MSLCVCVCIVRTFVVLQPGNTFCSRSKTLPGDRMSFPIFTALCVCMHLSFAAPALNDVNTFGGQHERANVRRERKRVSRVSIQLIKREPLEERTHRVIMYLPE
jgi:hypothetical protein